MDLDAARTFINDNHHAVLATLRAEGSAQMSPVLAGVDDSGRAIVSTTADSVKVRNLRRDPRAFLCILPDQFFGEWLQVEGTAQIVELPDAMPLLEDYYRNVAGEHDDWEEYRAAMRAENRVLVRVELTRAGPKRSG